MPKTLLKFLYPAFLLVSFMLGKNFTISSSATRHPASEKNKLIGQTEKVSLGKNKFMNLTAKVDSGAESASIHAYDIVLYEKFEENKQVLYVKFKTIDDEGNEFELSRKVFKKDTIKNSNGISLRFFILETIWIADSFYEVEINLANRKNLTYKFLIGKKLLLQGGYIIDLKKKIIAYKN